MTSRALLVVLVAVAVTATTAHFAIVPPTPGRGFDEGTETTPPCGGFAIPGERIAFTVDSSRIHLEIYDGAGNVTMFWGNGSAPAVFVPIPNTFHAVNSDTSAYTLDVPLNGLGIGVGQAGTIQVIFTSDEVFFQCQDVTTSVAEQPTPTPTNTAPPGSQLTDGALIGIMAAFCIATVLVSVGLSVAIVKRRSYQALS